MVVFGEQTVVAVSWLQFQLGLSNLLLANSLNTTYVQLASFPGSLHVSKKSTARDGKVGGPWEQG